MNQKTHLFFILFYLELFNSNHGVVREARDFWTAYFYALEGKEFFIDDDCLSGKFIEFYINLEKELTDRNFYKAITVLSQMIKLEQEKCPLREFRVILKDFKTASRNGTLIKNVLKFSTFIQSKLTQFLQSDKSGLAMGNCIGEITKIAIYGLVASPN